MRNPLVSILINNYNYGRFLPEAIESAISQSYGNIEVIVVDDGSTDNSRDIISNYGKTITPILKANEGQASALNAGYETSRGDIICFLDSDDVFTLNKVERIVGLFEGDSSIGWCFHDLRYIDGGGKALVKDVQYENCEVVSIDLSLAIVRGRTRFPYEAPATSGLCFRRGICSKIFPIPVSIFPPDNFMKFAALYLSSGLHIFEGLSSQRIHENNLYTFRQNAYAVQIEASVKIAFYLRERFPETAHFTDKMFTWSLGRAIGARRFWKILGLPELRKYLSRYMSFMKLGRYGHRIAFNIIRQLIRHGNEG